jgi:hypothetical protein
VINGKNRSYLIGIVALYLLYISYELFQGRGETNTTMTPTARILFIVFFILAAAGLLVYAVRVWKRSGEEEQKSPQDDNNNLK